MRFDYGHAKVITSLLYSTFNQIRYYRYIEGDKISFTMALARLPSKRNWTFLLRISKVSIICKENFMINVVGTQYHLLSHLLSRTKVTNLATQTQAVLLSPVSLEHEE
jgi:hypothetical protein